MSEISRNIFNAVDVLVDKKLSNYKADLTASYIICDNSRAAEGIYTVSNNKDKGTVSFLVYKQTTDNYTYKIGDSVYILIPGGDYKEKKFIMGLENEIKDRIVPEQKEPPTHFISLGDSYSPEAEELPATLILNGSDKSHQISQKELTSPRILVNYKKIRISATLNVNLDTKTAVDLNSSSYAIKFVAHDDSNDRDFIYTLSSNDILSNLYYFGNDYYTFTKDIDIDIDNFSISKYTLLLEQTGILTDLKGESNNIKGKIILKNLTISFGCLSSEYQDEIFAYTENNIKTFTDNINLSIGVKINKDEKEADTLTGFFKAETNVSVYWEQLINGIWYPFIDTSNKEDKFTTSINITNDIVNLTLRGYIGNKKEDGKTDVWNGKYSNSLSLDNSLKTQYNYNIRIFSEYGNLLKKTDTTTLTVKLYQNNKEIELGDNKYNFTTSKNIVKELKYSWYKNDKLIEDENNFSLTVDGTDISTGNGTNYSCKLQIGQTNSEGIFQSQEEAYDTLTLRTYEEPKETALYEIVSDYDEIGVCYEKITTSETVSKGLQYFPDENINLKLYKIQGSSREQILSGKLYYGFTTTQLNNLTELPFTLSSTSPSISLSIGDIKFINIENGDSAEQQYSKFKDKDRYIYIVYKDDNNNILAEKWIYLVHATSSILANFETTAFGFNDLTEDGTKGIKFEAAGGMNFYAGDVKKENTERNIITIWKGNAAGTDHGEKVFYVTSEGNVELNNANIRGSLMSKKQEEVSLLSQSDYFLISDLTDYKTNILNEDVSISYSVSDFWIKDYSKFTNNDNEPIYLFTNIHTDLLPSFGIKEPFIYDNNLKDQKLTITFSDKNSFITLEDNYYSVTIVLVYKNNNNSLEEISWYKIAENEIIANASYNFDVSAKIAKNYLTNLNFDITNFQLLGFKIYIDYNPPENDQVSKYRYWLGECYIDNREGNINQGLCTRRTVEIKHEPLNHCQADINSIKYLFKDITYTTYAYYFSDNGTSILRNKQYAYSLYSPKIEAVQLDLIKIGSSNKISISANQADFSEVGNFLYPLENVDAIGLGKASILLNTVYSASLGQRFGMSQSFYFHPFTFSPNGSSALFGTLYVPKIDFDTGSSATGNISISGDGIQIIRGQIDSDGNISTSAYIGNQYRDGFSKAPIQIKSYGTAVDDTYIPALSFQDINDTSINDSNENVQTFWTMGYRNNLKCFEILGVDIIGNETEQGMGGIRIPKSMVDDRHLLNIDEFIYLKRKYCSGEVKLAAQSNQQFSTNPASLADLKDGLTPITIAAEPSGDPGVIAHPNGWIHNSTNVEATIYGVFYYFLYVPSWLWYLEG